VRVSALAENGSMRHARLKRMRRRRVTQAKAKPNLGLCLLLGMASACHRPMPTTVSLPHEDDFSRETLGSAWFVSGGQWRIVDGYLFSAGARNAPLFLLADLPNDVRIEFDAYSETTEVDTKCELMTDGRRHASGYIFVLGGWNNTLSAIARLDEHGRDRKERKPTLAEPRKWHHWTIIKKGPSIRWDLDGSPYMTFQDDTPLSGPGQNRFAFSNWENRVRYDNLRISALSAPASPPLSGDGPVSSGESGVAAP
jgi:hypothetical protein